MGEVLQKKVKQYAEDNLGTRVWAKDLPTGYVKKGKGECWDLAYMALKTSNAYTPYDYGTNHYKWSKDIASISSAKPGDIIQYKRLIIDIYMLPNKKEINKKIEDTKKKYTELNKTNEELKTFTKQIKERLKQAKGDKEEIAYCKSKLKEFADVRKHNKKYKKSLDDYMKQLKKDLTTKKFIKSHKIGVPDHTAIIKAIKKDGLVEVYEQNMGGNKVTHTNEYYLVPGIYKMPKTLKPKNQMSNATTSSDDIDDFLGDLGLGSGSKSTKSTKSSPKEDDKMEVVKKSGSFIIYHPSPKLQ